MNTYPGGGGGGSNITNPRVTSVQYNDGTVQYSAEDYENIHIRKKLRTDNDSLFGRHVVINGNLTVSGHVIFNSAQIPDTSQNYVDQQIASFNARIGWDNATQKWRTSGYTNLPAYDLDTRLNSVYTKNEMDSLLTHTLAIEFAPGNGVNTFNTSLIPQGNSFTLPQVMSGVPTYFFILNSNYGSGKILTSDANGIATWQEPGATTSNVQSIQTTLGQTNVPSFSIHDNLVFTNPTMEFLPLVAHDQYTVQHANDCVIRSTGKLALTAGYGSGIIRPAGIRMSHGTNGALELYGGWAYNGENTSLWARSGTDYLGTYSGTNIRLDDEGIHMMHHRLNDTGSTKLYGIVHVRQRIFNTPSWNKYPTTINPLLTVGEPSAQGAVTVHGNITTNALTLTTATTPVTGRIWTCVDANGLGKWEVPTASSNISSFSENVVFENKLTVADDPTHPIDLDCQGHCQAKSLHVLQTLSTNAFSAHTIHAGDNNLDMSAMGTQTTTFYDITNLEPELMATEIHEDPAPIYTPHSSAINPAVWYDPIHPEHPPHITHPPPPPNPNHYIHSSWYPVCTSVTSAGFKGQIEYNVPMYIQNDFSFTNVVSGHDTTPCNFIICPLRYEIRIVDVDTDLVVAHTNIERYSMSHIKHFQLMYFRDNYHFWVPKATGYLSNLAIDHNGEQIHSYQLRLGDLKFIFHPPFETVEKNYSIQIRAIIVTSYEGTPVRNRTRNFETLYQSFTIMMGQRYRRLLARIGPAYAVSYDNYANIGATISTGNYVETDLSGLIHEYPSFSNWNYYPTPAFVNEQWIINFERAQTFRYPFLHILNSDFSLEWQNWGNVFFHETPTGDHQPSMGRVWETSAKNGIFYPFGIHRPNSNVAKWRIEPQLDNPLFDRTYALANTGTVKYTLPYNGWDQVGTFTNSHNHKTSINYPQASSTTVKIHNASITHLTVTGSTRVYSTIYALGYGGRRGIGYGAKTIASGIHSLHPETDNSVMNFFWTGSHVEFWVDQTMVHKQVPNFSDRRLKQDFCDVYEIDFLDRLSKLMIYSYTFVPKKESAIETSLNHIGVIADELQNAFPEFPHLVLGEKNEVDCEGNPVYQSVNYNELTIVALRAIQELKSEVSRQKRNLKRIETELNYLRLCVLIAAFIPIILVMIFPRSVVLLSAIYAS